MKNPEPRIRDIMAFPFTLAGLIIIVVSLPFLLFAVTLGDHFTAKLVNEIFNSKNNK